MQILKYRFLVLTARRQLYTCIWLAGSLKLDSGVEWGPGLSIGSKKQKSLSSSRPPLEVPLSPLMKSPSGAFVPVLKNPAPLSLYCYFSLIALLLTCRSTLGQEAALIGNNSEAPRIL